MHAYIRKEEKLTHHYNQNKQLKITIADLKGKTGKLWILKDKYTTLKINIDKQKD